MMVKQPSFGEVKGTSQLQGVPNAWSHYSTIFKSRVITLYSDLKYKI